MFTKEASKAVGLQSDLTDSDLSVMLRFLARDKGLLVYDDTVSVEQCPAVALLISVTDCQIQRTQRANIAADITRQNHSVPEDSYRRPKYTSDGAYHPYS